MGLNGMTQSNRNSIRLLALKLPHKQLPSINNLVMRCMFGSIYDL
jgi:hypothetical protein